MNILEELFGNLATFSEYVSGVDTSNSLDDLKAPARTARKRIESVITAKVFTAILSSEDEDLLDALRMAMANMTLSVQLVFDVINRRKSDIDVYKYELEGMKRSYMENYYNAMDSLVQQLMCAETEDDDTISPAALWKKARYCTVLSQCQIQTADEFDTIYPIDLSYLFFFRIVPLQKECLDERLGAYFSKTEDEQIVGMLKLALAKKTIAKALRRFDILEFPPVIRNLFDDNTASRSGKDEHDAMTDLADRLEGEADDLTDSVDLMLTDESMADISSYSAYNKDDDVIVMAP